MIEIKSTKKPRRWSLQTRLTLLLIVALLIFQIAMMAVSANMGLLPLMRQSVEDLSNRMIQSARYWSSLNGPQKIVYERISKKNAGFYFFDDRIATDTFKSDLVFNTMLSTILTKKLKQHVQVNSSTLSEKDYYWIDIIIKNKNIKIGFEHKRIGTNPSAIIIILLALNIVFSILTAFIYVRYITRPLKQLLNAAKSLGRGIQPSLEHKNNSREIEDLYNQFEKMSIEVQSLLENRNTLLIGISHELRTPITRLTLLLEMARQGLGIDNFNDCNQVLTEMNAIIGQFLSLGKGISVQESNDINLNKTIRSIIKSFSTDRIQYYDLHSCIIKVPEDALKRVVSNLLDNALKYSDDKKVDIRVQLTETSIEILVLDRGIGIPKDKTKQILQAFVRIKSDKKINIKGLGLGLALSHLIAQTYGWSLNFGSRHGSGTIVKLIIPKIA